MRHDEGSETNTGQQQGSAWPGGVRHEEGSEADTGHQRGSAWPSETQRDENLGVARSEGDDIANSEVFKSACRTVAQMAFARFPTKGPETIQRFTETLHDPEMSTMLMHMLKGSTPPLAVTRNAVLREFITLVSAPPALALQSRSPDPRVTNRAASASNRRKKKRR